MRILFVSATEFEVPALISNVGFSISDLGKGIYRSTLYPQHALIVTGVGMVATAYALGRELATNQYDLAINLGIAGSFDRSIALGDVIEVTKDTLTELGAEDDETFLPITQLGFGEDTFAATANLADLYKGKPLPKVTAITVNTVHGNTASIQKLQTRLKPELESMEGAAFFYACKDAGVASLQIRAVSNYVEKRNREAWQIGLAIKNLNTFALELLKRLDV